MLIFVIIKGAVHLFEHGHLLEFLLYVKIQRIILSKHVKYM